MESVKTVETQAEPTVLAVLAEVADIVEPVGLQEEAELPARILAEFVSVCTGWEPTFQKEELVLELSVEILGSTDEDQSGDQFCLPIVQVGKSIPCLYPSSEQNSRKKDKLLCSQLQVVDFLQNFLAREDISQDLDPLASEDLSRKKASEAKEQWKELKATYQEHVEAIKSTVTQALPRMEEVQRKRIELQEAFEQLQAKKQAIMEKLKAARNQWKLQQEKRLQSLAEVSAEVKERQAETQQKLEQLYQELRTLKQQAEWEKDKLQRHQTFLQLLYTLQGTLLVPEMEAEGRATPPPVSP